MMRPEHWDRPYPRPRLVERQPGPCVNRYRRQYDRASQMLALVMVLCVCVVVAFGLGIVYARSEPVRTVPVGNVEAEFEDSLRLEGP